MRRDIEFEAAKMRERAEREYIREGEPGWKLRRGQVERRRRDRERKAEAGLHLRMMEELERQRMTRKAEAVFDATHGTTPSRATVSEVDTENREESLMGLAIEEGMAHRRHAQQTRRDQLRKAFQEAQLLQMQPIEALKPIHPSVELASYSELIAAGWGDFERSKIPASWRTRRPAGEIIPASAISLNGKAPKSDSLSNTGRKLA